MITDGIRRFLIFAGMADKNLRPHTSAGGVVVDSIADGESRMAIADGVMGYCAMVGRNPTPQGLRRGQA